MRTTHIVRQDGIINFMCSHTRICVCLYNNRYKGQSKSEDKRVKNIYQRYSSIKGPSHDARLRDFLHANFDEVVHGALYGNAHDFDNCYAGKEKRRNRNSHRNHVHRHVELHKS